MHLILILNSNLLPLLCKLCFDKAVKIGRNTLFFKLYLYLKKKNFDKKKRISNYYAKHYITKYKPIYIKIIIRLMLLKP